MPFFSNADIPIAFETLAWVQAFLIDLNPNMKRSHDSTGESVCPFAKPVLAGNALYMAFHHEVNGKSAEPIELPWLLAALQIGLEIERCTAP